MSVRRRDFLKSSAVVSLTAACSQSTADKTSGDPIDSLPNLTADLKPIAVKEFELRIERARKLMVEHGFSAFFTESGSTLQYFTGVEWGRSERMFAFVIPPQGPPAFICPAFEEDRARQQIRFGDADIRTWEEHQSPYARVDQILREHQAGGGRVAIEPTTRLFLISGLRQAAPAVEFSDGRTISDGCRMVKDEVELENMRLADRITKSAYQAALQGLREGMTEDDLARRVSQAHSRLGARGGAMVLFGPHSALPHGSRNVRELRPGDAVLIDGGCAVNGYRSDVTRTTVFGTASSKQRQVWQIVRDAQSAALEAARPGIACQQLDRVARQWIENAGYGPGYQYFTHRLGHGIGLDGHESPYLVEGNKLETRPGMTFSNEPGIYIVGEWGVRHEDIMVITGEGAEILGNRTRELENPLG